MTNIYESDVFSRLPDHSMHPGGLRLTDRAVRLADIAKGMAVADIGCGAGSTAAFLTDKYGFKMVGLEISEPLIQIGLKNCPGLHFIRWDCKTLPFEPASLDAVLFECSLSVIGYSGKTLDECATALKPNGTLIMSDLLAKKSTGKPSALPALSELEKRLKASGFEVVVSEDHTPALITYAAQLTEQFGKPFDPSLFFGTQLANGFKLSEHCYHLLIARNIKT